VVVRISSFALTGVDPIGSCNGVDDIDYQLMS